MPRGRKPQSEKVVKDAKEEQVNETEASPDQTNHKQDDETVKEVNVKDEKAKDEIVKEEIDTTKEQLKNEVVDNRTQSAQATSQTETSVGGWGEPVDTNSAGGWDAPEEVATVVKQPAPSSTGSRATSEQVSSTTKQPAESSTGGWGAPEEAISSTKQAVEFSTRGWGEPIVSNEQSNNTPSASTGGWGAPEIRTSSWKQSDRDDNINTDNSYQQSSSSYRTREPRSNDSYSQHGGYQSEQRGRNYDRPPRSNDRNNYGERPRGGPVRPDIYRDDSFSPRDGGQRRRYDGSDSYNREDKRPRYDDRYNSSRPQDDRHNNSKPMDDRYNSSRPQDGGYNRGRNDSHYSNSRDDRIPSRPPYDDYERGRGRDYDRSTSYESRGDNEKPYEPRVPRERKPFPVNVTPSKAIGIFGLSIHATENDLREFLAEELADITNYKITIVYDLDKGTSRGFGFVYFQCLGDSISAKERLAGKSIKGKEIRVDFSKTDALRPSYR